MLISLLFANILLLHQQDAIEAELLAHFDCEVQRDERLLFSPVVELHFLSSPKNGKLLSKILSSAPFLYKISFEKYDANVDALRAIKENSRIEWLAVGVKKENLAILREISELRTLKFLEIWSDHIVDSDLISFRRLRRLEYLALYCRSLSHAGLIAFADCPIRTLVVSSLKADSEKLEGLSGFQRLESLWIALKDLSAENLSRLKELKALKYLDLQIRSRRVNDNLLHHFETFPSLRVVWLFAVEMSNKSRDDIKQILKNRKINIISHPQLIWDWVDFHNNSMEYERKLVIPMDEEK